MNTLRKRLTGLYTATAGLILLLITAAFLAFSIRELKNGQAQQFGIIWDSLSLRFQSSQAFSHSYLSQTEAEYQLIIHIQENGIPFLYPGSWKPETKREALIERAKEKAGEEGVLMDQAPVSSSANISSLMTIEGDNKDRYYARVLVLPAKYGGKSLCAIGFIPPLGKALGKTIPYLCLLTLLGMGCLLLISWKFVGWSLKPVEESQKKQAQFIAAASHELRSPLAVLRSAIAALDSDLPEAFAPQKGTLLPLLEKECARMARLVDDMLLLPSADAKTWTIRQEDVDMDTLLIEVYEAFFPLCREKGISLSLKLPDDPLPHVLGDAQRLSQLFFILLDNAKTFTPSGRSILLSADAKASVPGILPGRAGNILSGKRPLPALSVQVTDEGCGIPPKLRPLVFDRFFQADNARSHKQHFGLGLSIARELTLLHKGTISLSEAPGGGCCFTVTLPCAAQKSQNINS